MDKGTERTRYHSTKADLGIGARSFIKSAAGMPVARVISPRALNVHARLVPWMRASTMKLMTAPPSPPAA
jgi:hypothetical protein